MPLIAVIVNSEEIMHWLESNTLISMVLDRTGNNAVVLNVVMNRLTQSASLNMKDPF